MKKNIIFSIIALLLIFNSSAYSTSRQENLANDFNKCVSYSNQGDRVKTKSCYAQLLQKYNTVRDTYALPAIHYNYGIALYNLKEYSKAKAEFTTALQTEKNNAQIINGSKNYIGIIDKQIADIQKAKRMDKGDYYSKLDEVAKWSNPGHLQVYIASSTGKEYLLKKAFTTWDNKLDIVSFSYVKSPTNANIVASINKIDEIRGSGDKSHRVGVTKSTRKDYPINGRKIAYFGRAEVKVSYQDLNGKNFSDNEILSIALHEIGHALGIVSHSQDRGDIMFADTSSYKVTSPSTRDVNTVKMIYRN